MRWTRGKCARLELEAAVLASYGALRLNLSVCDEIAIRAGISACEAASTRQDDAYFLIQRAVPRIPSRQPDILKRPAAAADIVREWFPARTIIDV
jgi:hypothetical protein